MHIQFDVPEKNPYQKSLFSRQDKAETRSNSMENRTLFFRFLRLLVKSRNFFNAKFEFLSSFYP